MRPKTRWRPWLWLAVIPFLAAEPLAPEVLLLARVQAKVRLGLSGVPAYACDETISRAERSPGTLFFQKIDELKLQVAEIGSKELYARAGEHRFQDTPLIEMVGRGLISTGMFYHVAHSVFAGRAPRFQYVGRKRFEGRQAVQYDFDIAPLFAMYTLHFNGHAADCGMRGSIWAEESSLDLIRIHVEATAIPAELKVRSTETDIDYNRASIDGKSFLIPRASKVTIVMAGGAEDRNQIRYSNCRKYGVESTLSFQ